MEKLIGMTDFVSKYVETGCAVTQLKKLINYSDFLKQPLELWMFVPCDENGNILEEPKPENYFPINKAGNKFTEEDKKGLDYYYSPMMNYQQAKDHVLFEGFEICNRMKSQKCIVNNNFHLDYNFKQFDTIEDLVKYSLQLTKKAQKIIGI